MATIEARLIALGQRGHSITPEECREAIQLLPRYFMEVVTTAGHDAKAARAIATKFRDAGRRSPPWRPTSSRVPGRPQDGADGNRRNRWLFEETHKFYADERTATLVELRLYFQAFSMLNAPAIPGALAAAWEWLADGPIRPGTYRDPIQQEVIDFAEVIANPRLIESGHFVPLDRGGRHVPDNTFLTLRESNVLQGSRTLDELLRLIERILERHGRSG